MNKKADVSILVAVAVVLLGAAYYWYVSSPSQQAASARTPTVVVKPTVLLGTIQAIKGSVLTLSLQQGGTANITVSSTTSISKNVPKDAKTLAAEFAEYQTLKAKAGGKPFTLPSSSAVKMLSLTDLKAGLYVLVTPQAYSTSNATAVSILVVPAYATSTAAVR